jgi:hypothetical protein
MQNTLYFIIRIGQLVLLWELISVYCGSHTVFVTHYFAGDKMKKNEVGRACSAYRGREKACTGFWWENLRESDQWGDPGVDGIIILRRIFRKRDVGVWTGLSWLRIETGDRHL